MLHPLRSSTPRRARRGIHGGRRRLVVSDGTVLLGSVWRARLRSPAMVLTLGTLADEAIGVLAAAVARMAFVLSPFLLLVPHIVLGVLGGIRAILDRDTKDVTDGFTLANQMALRETTILLLLVVPAGWTTHGAGIGAATGIQSRRIAQTDRIITHIGVVVGLPAVPADRIRSEEHTSELQ